MQIHNLVQGSQEWHAYRAEHFNASDAPAMLGVSPYKTRTDLLHERFTGIAKEIDATTQARFDDGHRFEALARPLAEELVGEDLYPVTGSLGELSASFDGLTMAEDIAWEHKTLNDDIRAAQTVEDLGAHYRVQMEQQLLVSGASKCLFLASCWDHEGQLVEAKHFWYEPQEKLRKKILAGWQQFAKDLVDYKPREIAVKPAAEAIMHLPALAVQIRGEVTTSNLPAFKAAAEQFIANIKTDLQTDEDFANAEATVKFCDKAEKDLELTKSAAIAQTASIDDLMRTIDYIKDELRSKRLMLEKLVASKKTAIKEKILSDAKAAYTQHTNALEAEIKPISLVVASPDFAAAAKNKRTLASMHDAVDSELARAKIAADAAATAVRTKLAWYGTNAKGFEFLFMDMQQIIQKADEDFQLIVTSRIGRHKQDEAEKLEAERERIAAEEQAKAQERIRTEQREQLARDKAEFDAKQPKPAVETRPGRLDPQAAAAQVLAEAAAAVAAEPIEQPLAVTTEPDDGAAALHFVDIVNELLNTRTADEIRYLLEETLAKVGLSAWAPA